MFVTGLIPATAVAESYAFIGSWPTQGSPLGLAIDGDGTIVLSTPTASPPLYRHSVDGVLLSQIGFSGNSEVYGIACTGTGHIFYAAYSSSRVWHISSTGEDLGGWGRSGCCFRYLAVDDARNVYITDPYDNRVRKYASSDLYGDYFVGEWPSPRPSGIVVGGGFVNVASLDGGTIRKYTVDGRLAVSFETGADGVEAMAFRDHRFYLVDRGRSRILVFSEGGSFVDSIGSSPPGYADVPAKYVGVVVADDGTLFAGDREHGRVLKFAPSVTPVHLQTWGRIKALYR